MPWHTKVPDLKNNPLYLEPRLNEVTEQMAEKAKQSDLEITNSNVALKADKTYTDNQMLSKRDKGVKITNDDLDLSADAKKIKLINLADEVQQALTGNAPALTTIENGAVVREKIADEAVSSSKTTDSSMFGLLIYSTKAMDFNFVTNKITFHPFTNLLFKKTRYVLASTLRELSIATLNRDAMYGLYYNRKTDTFNFYDTATVSQGSVAEDDILIAAFNINAKLISTSNYFTIEGRSNFDVPDNSSFGMLVSDKSYPNFDFVNKKIIFYSNTNLIFNKKRYVIASGGVNKEIDITSFMSSGQVALFYNKTSNTFSIYSTAQIGSGLVTDADILISTFMASKKFVWMPGGYLIDGANRGISLSNLSRFNGKTANFLGDSITWGFSPIDGTQLSIKFVDLVKEKLGLTTANNYGISGSTLGSLQDGSRNPMVDRYVDMGNADLVCVFGGTNDWNFNVPLGTINDTDKYTYYGALKIMMNGLYTKYPNSTIVFFTPLHRQGDSSNGQGVSLNAYRKAVIEVGEMFGIAVLDLYSTSGIFPDNATNYNTLVPDGRHPNEVGHEKIACRIAGFLNTL